MRTAWSRAIHSSRFVGLDLPLDLFGMGTMVGPGVGQIFGAQGRVGEKQIGLTGVQSAGLDEHPDRNPGTDDAGLTAADAGLALDAGKRFAST